MRSFAVVALIGAASAAAVYPVESSSAPVYEAYPAETSSAPAYDAEYPASSSSAVYEVASSSSVKYEEYPISSASSSAYYAASTPVYSAQYPASSSSVKYEEYPVTSTKVVPETTFVCPTPTVVTYEEKTYTVSSATTLTISSYSTVVIKTTQTPEAQKPSSAPVYSATVPAVPTHIPAPYPSKNVTAPHSSAPQGTATGAYPTSTKPATPEFTGAAAQAGVGLLAVVGALAAFL